jgi:hypothetical protein
LKAKKSSRATVITRRLVRIKMGTQILRFLPTEAAGVSLATYGEG